MVELSLALLGPFSAVVDQRPFTQFRTKAVQGLLVYLVCQPHQAHQRDALMALFWPDVLPQSAQANLRHALYHLRQAIPTVQNEAGEAVPFVFADRHTIQLNPDGCFQLDLHQFETLTSSTATVADWETAVSLYRDEFLTGFYLPDSPAFENWLQEKRTDYQRRCLDTLSRLTKIYIENGHLNEAERTARRQLEMDNLREEAHGQLMQVMAENGRRTDALSHYQTLRHLLKDELDITPSPATETLVEAIRSDNFGKEAKSPAPRRKEDVPQNLPAQATPFIGRQAELADLDNLLANPQTRLVTILGAGGMGKTRLSLAAAERQLTRQQFAQGVFFVSLAGLGESGRMLSAIAEAMALRLEKGETQLFNHLRTRQILLVLDNFEHLLDGSDLVGKILQAAPQLQILITSRERLRLHGEQVYPIQGLVVDETAVSDDARTLFLQAARRIRPSFQIAEDDRPILNQICRLTEGMPLALELAAAWVDLLTLAEIAAEIQRNLDFLESDLRDMPARHRSMQAVFDASWQRLSPAKQQLLVHLTIFKGGFTREAVTAVTNASLQDLAALVNKSLLTFDVVNGRYHMHELLRQYAAAQQDVDDGHLDRHSQYYCHWLASQFDGLVGAEQMAVGRKIKADIDNLHTAVLHALQRERLADLDQALPTLSEYYRSYGHLQEGIHLLQQIHTGLDQQRDSAPFILFWTSIWLSEFYGRLGQANSEAFLQQANALLETPFFRQRDTRAEQARILHEKAFHVFRQEPIKAVELFRQSQALLEQLGDRVESARNLIGLARAVRNTGDLDQAQLLAEQGLLLARTLGNTLIQLDAQILLANLAGRHEKFDEAEALLQECTGQLRQINQPELLALGLAILGYVQLEKGLFNISLQTSQEGDQIYQELGNRTFQGMARLAAAHSRMHLGEYSHNTTVGQEIADIAHVVALHPQGRRWLHLLYSQLAMLRGDMLEARAQIETGDWVDWRFDWNDWQFCLGIIAVIEGDLIAARKLLESEIREAVEHHLPRTLALSLTLAAYLTATQGEPEQGLTLYAVAQQNPFIANSRWMADVVGERITAVSQHLSPEAIAAAQARGRELDLVKTAELILANGLKYG